MTPPIKTHAQILSEIVTEMKALTPQEFEERLAKVRGTPNHLMFVELAEFGQFVADNAHTKPGLAALHGVEYKPVIASGKENQNGQENSTDTGGP